MEYKFEFVEAIEAGDLAVIQQGFEPSDLECDDYMGSLLHYAATAGTLEIVEFLVDRGADVNRRGGTFDCPAITYAAGEGKLDIVCYLFEAGSVLDTTHALRNPLLSAAREGHLDVVGFLLTTSIDPHATYRIPSGELINAFTEADDRDHVEIVELLKSYGCHRPVEGVDIPLWEPEEYRDGKSPEVEETEPIIAYMEQRFGPVDKKAIQELLPLMEGISVSIQIIPPNEMHPYLVLFTKGMSDLPMTVPVGQEAWRYAELVMHLPEDWVQPGKAKSSAKWMWPVQWLHKLAYYPHLNETWLGLPAAIVSSDDPPVPLGPKTKQTCLLMIPDFANLDEPFQKPDGSLVHFFTVVPLYTEERDYELKHGMEAFFRQFIDHKVPMTVEPNRPSFVEKQPGRRRR